LSKGLNYAVAPAVLPTEDIITGTEKAICSLPDEIVEEIQETGSYGSPGDQKTI
jgi:hypothetical protein